MPERLNIMDDDESDKRRPEVESVAISWIGRADGGQPNKKIWRGTIGVAETVAANIENYKKLAERCYKYVSFGAALRCIDGRPAKENPQELGPQMAGATPALTVPFHISEGAGNREHFIIGDYIEIVKRHDALELAFKLGAHRDNHATGDKIGCGALDKMLEIMDTMADPEAQPIILEFSRLIMGADYSDQVASEVCESIIKMNNPKSKARWMMVNDDYENITGTPAPEFKKEVLSGIVAKSGEDAVETVLGDHKEILLIVNKRRGETFDKDGFAALTDNLAQAFNYDYWYSVSLAEAFYTDADQSKNQQKFLLSQVIYNVAAAMVLTDGSLEVGIRE